MKEARDLIECDDDGNYDPSAYEMEPKDLGVGISIKNLTKVYDTVSTCTTSGKHYMYICLSISVYIHTCNHFHGNPASHLLITGNQREVRGQ